MNELQSILSAWRELGDEAAEAVLVTVVHVQGSAYRRPGARMLIRPDGRRVGTISGGCLEGEVARKAAWWTSAGDAVVRTFDQSAPDVAWDFGLGCNGVITLLLESVAAGPVREALEFIDHHQRADVDCAVATVIRAEPTCPWRVGDRLLWDAAGRAGGNLAGTALGDEITVELCAALATQSSRLLHTPEADVFVEWLGLPTELLVFGAGHDVVPLARIASVLGWQVTIADSRPAYAHAGRFPDAAQVVTLPPSGDLSGIAFDHRTAVVVMTHNYPQDLLLVPQILARSPAYLGLLGPRRRAEKLLGEIGLKLAEAEVHAPVGLDLGSDHPETIALSIVAEIQAVLAGRSSGSLRWREGAIHAAVPESGAEELQAFSGSELEPLTVCAAVA